MATAESGILIVDDEPKVLDVVAAMLRRAGFRVVCAATVAAAMKLLDADRGIAVMVADIVMPGMSGVSLADSARALRPDVKVAFITGARDLPLERLRPIAEPFILKPFQSDELVAVVRGLLGAPA